MDFGRLIQMIGGRLLRRFVTKGITTGLKKAASKTRATDPAARQQGAAGKDISKRLRQTQKMMRRFRP